MPIIDIKFENDGERYMYSPHKASSIKTAIYLWRWFVSRHFKTPCKMVDIKVTKLRTEQ